MNGTTGTATPVPLAGRAIPLGLAVPDPFTRLAPALAEARRLRRPADAGR